ncbi:unnamed protein product [Periconia digitata]|uniref:Protein kinase domain-containing protein n=1 Tax=Periconia digitata TaxID=1303443 RepID=A0A9W4XRA8_9PLEO|nr:unnamed protein product [Periconia digitata]
MVDPISLASLSLQVAQILGPAVLALRKAYREGKTLHRTLRELESDLDSIYELTKNINRLLSVKSFADAVRSVPNVDLVDSLERSLERCLNSAQKLLEVLADLGLDIDANRMKRTWRAWRLDRRLDEIDRNKRNFQDYKSSIQLAFQLLTTCKQMQIAERDDQHANDLKAQIGELQKAIDSIAQQITIRQVVPTDEEQTEILEGMKSMHDSSKKLERRATIQLEFITSRTSFSKLNIDETRPAIMRQESLSPPPEDEEYPSSPVSEASFPPGFTPFDPPQRGHLNTPSTSSSAGESSFLAQSSDLATSAILSIEDFETRVDALLSSAVTDNKGKNRPFSEEVISQLATMLNAVGKPTWGERPRTYLVLRLLGEVKAMDSFIFEGYKDIDFPYTEATLPEVLKSASSRRSFLDQQKYVLSPQSSDLVRGGRHRHLPIGQSGDTFFKIVGKLGSGGFSVVDRVRSKFTLQEYARKRIPRSGAFKDRKALLSFENEVNNLKRLSHHHLVEFVGSYTDRKFIAIIMQPVADMDLRRYLLRKDLGPGDMAVLRSFVGCLCSALAYLHEQQCRHKDIKPHNILIHGETVLLADFGTALHWTDPEGEITAGPPDAVTKLYIAPEIVEHAPRDKSSDVWSLGCVFLEVATILAGFTLQDKSTFFASLHRPSAAYWLNHDAIQIWLDKLSSVSGDAHHALHDWINAMTAFEPTMRPTAQDLVDQISGEQSKLSGYGKMCCFEEHIPSEDTSWQGSVAGDEIFETAQTISENTTMSSKAMLTPKPSTAEPILEQPADKLERQTPGSLPEMDDVPALITNDAPVLNEIPSYILDLSFQPTALDSDDQIKRWTLDETENTIPIREEIGQDGVDSLTQVENEKFTVSHSKSEYGEVMEERNKAKIKHVVRNMAHKRHPKNEVVGEQESRVDPTKSTIGLSAIDSRPTPAILEELEKIFLENRRHFERRLLQLKRKDLNWQSYVLALNEKSVTDQKHFTILLAASDFSNVALAEDVIKLVVKQKPNVVNETTIFHNSALHYAASQDRSEVAKFLIKNGINVGQQNFRKDSALHMALRSGHSRTAEVIIPHINVDEANAVNDRNRTPMHTACASRHITAKTVSLLLGKGASINTLDCYQATPLQLSMRSENHERTELLKAEVLRETPDHQFSRWDSNSAWSFTEGKAIGECCCELCCLRVSVEKTGHAIARSGPCCTCVNHLQVYGDDSLSYSDLSHFKKCLCAGCKEIQNQRDVNSPCGTPIGNDYLPYNESLKKNPRIFPPYTESPTHPINKDFVENPLPPYPGHAYYDELIQKHIEKSKFTGSQQEATIIALDQLAKGGFKSSRAYRKDPSKALRWVTSNFGVLTHVDTMVEILLDSGADINTHIDERSARIVDKAGECLDLNLLRLLIDRNVEIGDGELKYALFSEHNLHVRMLLTASGAINGKLGRSKITALHAAVRHYDMIGWHIPMLLAHGASTDIPDNDGNTPLHEAISKNKIHAAVALLESHARTGKSNDKGVTPLHIAFDLANEELISTMLSYGANVVKKIDRFDNFLFYAIFKNLGTTARLLIEEYNGDTRVLNKTPKNASTVWHILAYSKIQDPKLVDLIVRYNIDVNEKNSIGMTALHYAAWRGNVVVTQRLLQCGANKEIRDGYKGYTALEVARSLCHSEVMKCLGGTNRTSWWRQTRNVFLDVIMEESERFCPI